MRKSVKFLVYIILIYVQIKLWFELPDHESHGSQTSRIISSFTSGSLGIFLCLYKSLNSVLQSTNGFVSKFPNQTVLSIPSEASHSLLPSRCVKHCDSIKSVDVLKQIEISTVNPIDVWVENKNTTVNHTSLTKKRRTMTQKVISSFCFHFQSQSFNKSWCE